MRNIIILIIGILFISCSSTQVKKKVIDDFLSNQSQMKNVDILIEEAEPITKALQYYENAYNQRNLNDGEIRFAPNGPPPYKWEIDSAEIGILKRKHQNDALVYHWKKGDFVNPKFKIIPYQIIRKRESSQEYNYGFYLSRPLITRDKKHAFLFFGGFAVGGGEPEERAVLLKKINNKWIVLYYYNVYP